MYPTKVFASWTQQPLLSMDNDIDLVVFNMNEPGNIKRVVFGENIGTTVSNNVEK